MRCRTVLLFLAGVVALLALACRLMPAEGLRLGPFTLRTPTLSQVMYPEVLSPVVSVDTAEMAALQRYHDSTALYRHWMDSSGCRFWLPDNDESFFDSLFAAMETSAQHGRRLRVMHYGDSQLEMDHISSRLRARLQERFGGGGPGMVPLQPIVSSPTVSQWHSGELPRLAPFGDSLTIRSQGNYGPLVQCFRLEGRTVSSFLLGRNKHCDEHVRQCSHVGVLYRPHAALLHTSMVVQSPKQGRAAPADTSILSGDSLVALALWDADTAATRLRVTLQGSAEVYGVLLDDAPGVAVDNIPMRGCSGQQFTQIDSALLAASYALLDVGLIILQFGGNSVPFIKGEKALETYCQSIGRQIDRLHRCCPHVSILFVGPADMAAQIDGTIQSYPYMERIIDGLRATVNAHGAAYWSQYDAMGGRNTIKSWVRQGLAGSDYIHFSQQGADLMGDLLADALLTMYRYYRLRRTSRSDSL